jgi:hypothetical protein
MGEGKGELATISQNRQPKMFRPFWNQICLEGFAGAVDLQELERAVKKKLPNGATRRASSLGAKVRLCQEKKFKFWPRCIQLQWTRKVHEVQSWQSSFQQRVSFLFLRLCGYLRGRIPRFSNLSAKLEKVKNDEQAFQS